MSQQEGKQGLVDLGGEWSACVNKSPGIQCSFINRIREAKRDFCYIISLNEKKCVFKIDTGSDVSLVNRKFVRQGEQKFPVVGRRFKYPTREDVSIECEILAKVVLGENSLELPMLVSEITDDCLLGVDFLQKTNFIKVCDSFFGAPSIIRRIAQTRV